MWNSTSEYIINHLGGSRVTVAKNLVGTLLYISCCLFECTITYLAQVEQSRPVQATPTSLAQGDQCQAHQWV